MAEESAADAAVAPASVAPASTTPASTAPASTTTGRSTADRGYADRLVGLQTARWKRWLGVQVPYRWNLRRLRLGRTLDVGCGIGRNLEGLAAGSVGVDHNEAAVAHCRALGLRAWTTGEFPASADARPASFDALLLAHVVEHLAFDDAAALVSSYLPYVGADAPVVLITPQERGYRSDPTHVELYDFTRLERLAEACGLRVVRSYSFPFGRRVGRWFTYNEFVVVARRAVT